MPETIILIAFFVAVPLAGWGSYRLGVRNGRAMLGTRAAGARAAGMILLLALGLQLGGVFGSIAMAAVPSLYLLGWGRSRGELVGAD